MPRRTHEADRAIQADYEFFYDAQPEPYAAKFSFGAETDLVKGFEDFFLKVFWDADALVRNGYYQVFCLFFKLESHAGSITKLEGVYQKVGNDLFDSLSVCFDFNRFIGYDFGISAFAGLLVCRADRSYEIENFGKGKDLFFILQTATFEP